LNPPNAVIAIDGTSASGKSSTARAVAKALGYIYVDTGAMYRTLAWHCLQKQVDIHDPAAVAKLCRDWNASLSRAGNEVRLLVDGYFPEQEIRTKQVTEATPVAASVPEVREWMMQKQRECAQFGNLVMEGRDIGTHIFPATPHKFFLDACANERARRRAAQGVAENVAARDLRDTRRAVAPLAAAPDAVVINNSGMTVEHNAALILEKIKSKESGA